MKYRGSQCQGYEIPGCAIEASQAEPTISPGNL